MNRHASVNRVYRLIWSPARRALIPVAETARGRMRGSSHRATGARACPAARTQAKATTVLKATALILAACYAPMVFAQSLPQGGVVRAGSATIASTATRMDVTTTTSRTAIDWTSFSIGTGDEVVIAQPTSTSITVNRVVGADPSQIFGELSSNGQVVVANPNGIWFGPHARVDVAGIVATTNSLSDGGVAGFAGGGALNFNASTGSASIVNQGAITVAAGGLAGLVAPGVANAGTINAKRGTVVLASGAATTLDFYGDGLINLVVSGTAVAPTQAVDGSTVKAAVSNSGTIIADGGSVRLSANVAAGVLGNVIDMSGVIEARGVTTTGGVVELLGGTGSVAVSGLVDVSGEGRQSGGSITVAAGSPAATQDGIADIAGSLLAASASGAGGQIAVSGRIVTPSGAISANGATAGSVNITAATLTQSGAISADATTGAGGHINLAATDNIIQSTYASTTANSVSGPGGAITLNGGPDGRVFSSGLISAQGASGGDITLLAASIGLADASLNASGANHGGQILVGGGLHGQGEPSATTTDINPATTLMADALASGDGGTVVVWSASETIFEGSASARGGPAGGNGGLIEVSSGNNLAFSGSGDASAALGRSGTLLLDPKNIVIDSDAGNVAQFNLIDPDAGLGSGFGTLVVQLSNGTVLVTKPGDTVGGAVGAGSIFYFNPTTGALLAAFQGSHAGDAVGSLGVTFLNYTNWYNYYYLGTTSTLVNDPTKAYVISSPSWNNGAGAITWVAADSTVSGILSSSNSLVGSTTGDTVGANNGYNNLYLLPNDNYLVLSPNWSNGKGAATFGTASATLTGIVSSSNSLVGSTINLTSGLYNVLPGDNVGSGAVLMLANNNFLLLSPSWNAQAGAVTFGTETGGMATGVLSASNSLVGATGSQAYVTTDTLNGNSHSNAYFGGDQVGNYYDIFPLANGSYVVTSPNWDRDRGAVTLGNGTTGISGTVSTANSLTGTTPGIGTGGQGVNSYNGSTYYTSDYGWRGDYGGDQLGSGGVTVLANGNFVIASPNWNKGDGAVTFLPGSTTALGTGGSLATVTSANSLVGSHQSTLSWDGAEDANFSGGDSIGSLTALANSNYVVASQSWNGTMGAVTLMDGTNGHVVVGSGGTTGETVSASNSLVGSSGGDYVGGITPLAGSSNFVVSSPDWSSGRGEVTRVDGTTGLAGAVSSSNSLVGTTPYQSATLGADEVGSSIVTLANGNWIIVSPDWSMTKGAVTFELAGAIPTGNISIANSLVGVTAGTIYCGTCDYGQPAIFGGDALGSGGVTVLPNNNFIVLSPQWNANKGAVTFVAGTTGALVDGTASLTGMISTSNSLVGGNSGAVKISAYDYSGYSTVGLRYYVGGDQIGSYGTFNLLPNGNFVLTDYLWNSQAGAVTFGTGSGKFGGGAAFAGTVSSTNSLIGATAGVATAPADPTSANWTVVGGDQVGIAGIEVLASNYLILSPQWSNTAGAVTWAGGSTAITGVVSATNSLVGSTAGDMVGTTTGYNDVILLPDGNYIIGSPGWGGNRGAVTFGTPGTPVTGVVSAANSLVGSTAGDAVGSGGITALPGGDYVVNSPGWNDGTGAATWSQGTGAVTGVLSSTNSIVGMDTLNGSLVSSASTDPKAFFVALAADNGGEGGVILAGTDPTVWDFARAQANTVTIAPSLILSALNAGTSIVLEASNDITVNSAVVANSSATGALTLDAGRSVLVHAGINTGDGALTIIANDTAADGVINAQRSSGTAVITVDSGASLSSGTAPLIVDLAASTDKTFNTAGNITLGAVSGASVTVTNFGSASGDLTLNGIVTATDSGTSLLLATGGELINTAGSAALNPGAGRYLVYSADPRTNTPDGLTDPSHYFGESFAVNGPGTQAPSGNIYLYSVVPLLTVTSNSSAGYGTSASALTAQLSGFIDGDTLSSAVSGAASLTTAYVAGDAVGGSYPITVGLGSLTSPLGYGFSLVNGNVVVTKETLSIVLTGTISKTYNGNQTATLAGGNYMISGLYGSDSISVTKTAGSYASADAGTLIDVSTTLASGDFSAVGGTLLSNYTLPTGSTSGLIGTITPAPLTAALTGSITKVYDGGGAAILSGANYQLSGLVGSQSISVGQTSGTYASFNVGSALGVSATLASGNFTAASGTLLSDYSLPTLAAGNIGAITAAPLTVALTGSVDKVYNGAGGATLTAANYQLSGLVGSQSISVGQTSGTYASVDVGNSISISTTLASGNFSAVGSTILSDYTLPTGSISGLIGTITPAPLTATLTGSTTKVYDGGGTATLTGANYQLSGLVGSQSISVGQTSGTYASFNVGSALGVSATLTSGNFTAGSGTLLGNYSLPTAAAGAIGIITQEPLTAALTGSISKVYDGGYAATLSGVNYQLSGLVGSQSIAISQTSGSYASADVAAGIGVTAALSSGDFAAGSGTLLTNYSLPNTAAGAIGAITPATLSVSLVSGSVTRTYNGGESATLAPASYQLGGLVGGQSISVNQTSGSYASADAATGIGVTTTLAGGDFTAGSGTSLANYVLPVGTFTSNAGIITPAPLTAALTGSISKVYDGGYAATLSGVNYQLSGLVGSQSIAISQTSGSYASADVAAGIGVTAALSSGDFAAGSGTLLTNYSLPTTAAGAIGAITPATLSVSLVSGSVTRTYNGGESATLAPASYQLGGLVGGQSISVNQTSGSYASADAATGIGVTTTLAGGDFTAGSGTSLANYVLPVGTFTSNAGIITPAPLTAALTGSISKVYDGGYAATLTGVNYQLSGLVGSQSIGISQTSGSYASADVAAGIGVTAALSSGDFAAGSGTLLTNYSLPTTAAGAIGAITPATLSVSLVSGSVSRTYNGTGSAPIASADYRLSGLAAGQSIIISPTIGSYASDNVGTAIGVTTTLSGGEFAAGTGTLLSNYVLPVGTFTSIAGVIAPAPLSVSLTGEISKAYDGSSAALLSGANYQLSGLFGGDSISINQASGTYASTNVGPALSVGAILAPGDFTAASGTLLSNYSLPTAASGAIGAITPATLSVSLSAGSVTRPYDGAGGAAIASADYRLSGLAPGQSIIVSPTTGSYASDNVGTGIAITAGLSRSDFTAGADTLLTNYALPTAIAAGSVGAISPVDLTITANPEVRGVGAPNPNLSVSYSGFVDGQSAASLTTQPKVTSTATVTSPAGTYPISPSGAVDPNYVFTYVDGVMQVTQSQGPNPPPATAPIEDNISNTIENSVANNISAQDSGALAESGDTFTIGQSVSYLPAATDASGALESAMPPAAAGAPAEDDSGQPASAGAVDPDAAERSKIGRRNLDRDVHSYANAYLASIGLATSK